MVLYPPLFREIQLDTRADSHSPSYFSVLKKTHYFETIFWKDSYDVRKPIMHLYHYPTLPIAVAFTEQMFTAFSSSNAVQKQYSSQWTQ